MTEMAEMNDEMRAVFRAVEDALAAHRDITEMRDVSTALAKAAVMARMIAGFEREACLLEQLDSLSEFRDEIVSLLRATAMALMKEHMDMTDHVGKMIVTEEGSTND